MRNTWILLALGLLGFTISTVQSYVHRPPKDHYHETPGNRTSSPPKGSDGARRHNHKKPKVPSPKNRNVNNAMVKKVFIAAPEKCCHIGERVARRKLSCSMSVHIMSNNDSNASYRRSDYRRRRYSGKLFPKISRCVAKYQSHFEKCCKVRQEFMQQVKKMCKSRKGIKKQRCRAEIKRKFQS